MTEEQTIRTLSFAQRQGLVEAIEIIKNQGVKELEARVENWDFNSLLITEGK